MKYENVSAINIILSIIINAFFDPLMWSKCLKNVGHCPILILIKIELFCSKDVMNESWNFIYYRSILFVKITKYYLDVYIFRKVYSFIYCLMHL